MKHLLTISAVYLIGNPKRVTCGHPYLRILFPFVPQVHANFEFPRIDKMKPSPFQTLCFFSKRGARCPNTRRFWHYINPKMTKSTRFERGRILDILQTPYYPIFELFFRETNLWKESTLWDRATPKQLPIPFNKLPMAVVLAFWHHLPHFFQ